MIHPKLKKLMKKREFWFSAIFYPVLLISWLIAKMNKRVTALAEARSKEYFLIAGAGFTILVLMVIHEIYEKKIQQKVSGDKLKEKDKDWR